MMPNPNHAMTGEQNESAPAAAMADFTIDIDVFGTQVAVFRTEDQRIAALKENGLEPIRTTEASHASAHMDESADGRAWFSMVIKDQATKATWAHECVHMADFVMDHLGIPTDASNTEVRAYLVGHLFAGLEGGA